MKNHWNKRKDYDLAKPGDIKDIKVVLGKPPVWDAVCKAFSIQPDKALFTYGDSIYNPGGMTIPQYLVEHEKVHMAQQGHSESQAVLWWGRFLRDKEFRADQEARAYARQYDYTCQDINDREHRFKILNGLAITLSSALYNHCIEYQEALKLIKRYTKIR